MNPAELIAPWRIPGPFTFQQLDTGYVNTIYAVQGHAGKYILRIYKEGALARIRHEHALAAWLQKQAGLSFTVPAPIPTAAGHTLAHVDGTYAALIPFLPGVHPDFCKPDEAEAAGAALGELVKALARFEPTPETRALPTYGDLARLHPDPTAAVDGLPVAADWRRQIRTLLTQTLEQTPHLYDCLPKQVTHGDFTDGNALLQADKVTAIFDFELSAWDLRAMDYAIGIGGGPKSLRSGWGDWPVLEAFSRGYFRHHALTAEELEALPDLIRLRRLHILLKFAGRYQQGLDPEAVVAGMAWWTLNAEEWLEANGKELIRRARTWADPNPANVTVHPR